MAKDHEQERASQMSATQGSKGVLFIVCGPSGVGKTSLGKALRQRHASLVLSVSCTTRQPRHNERDGLDYHFTDKETFAAWKAAGRFAESASVHGNSYGTLMSEITGAWERNQNVFFDIDYQGAVQLKGRFPTESVSVLIVPPDMATLETRLRGRATDDEDVILRRLEAARHELEQFEVFDYIIVNDDFDHALSHLESVYRASQHRTYLHRQRLMAMLGKDEDVS